MNSPQLGAEPNGGGLNHGPPVILARRPHAVPRRSSRVDDFSGTEHSTDDRRQARLHLVHAPTAARTGYDVAETQASSPENTVSLIRSRIAEALSFAKPLDAFGSV